MKPLRVLAGAAALWAPFGARAEPPAELSGGRVRIEASASGVTFSARRGNDWIVIASGGASDVVLASGESVPLRYVRASSNGAELKEEFEAGGLRVTRTTRIEGDGPWIRVSSRLGGAAGIPMRSFADQFKVTERPDWSFAPSVGGFVPDAQYKAPVVLVQAGRDAFGVVPDLHALSRDILKSCNHALDLDVPAGPLIAVGFMPARLAYHSVYAEDPKRVWTPGGAVENTYYLLISADEEPKEAYREATRMLWRTFGKPGQAQAALQQRGTATPESAYWWVKTKGPVDEEMAMDRELVGLGTWDSWRNEVWEKQSRRKWMTVPLPGAPGGGVPTLRWGPGPALYLTAWFNTLRTSMGMALYARRTGEPDLLRLAAQTPEVALQAPGRDGAFKCIAVPTAAGTVWAAGDGGGDSMQGGFLGYDMSWTGYWLLRWREAGLPGSETVLPRCEALARFLCDRQEKDGLLPTRFGEDGSVDQKLSRVVKAETGPVALFLLELYSQDRDRRWLEAAQRGLAYMERDVIPLRQWYDFETFWSCSPRGPELDARTGQWPANDLALGQSVAAFLSCYRQTGDQGYLAQGEKLLDYLLLYQQVWTNPVLEGLNAPETLLGGFTTQNSDAEWSDARQSQFGSVLLDYYRATGNTEYLERGVAALRAQFPVSPCENWAHSGYGAKTGISSFHWGTGSGMAGIELEQDFLGDAVVDIAGSVAVGVDGIDVTDCEVRGQEIHLTFSSPFRGRRPPVFVFHAREPGRRYDVFANGRPMGSFTGAALQKGLAMPLSGP